MDSRPPRRTLFVLAFVLLVGGWLGALGFTLWRMREDDLAVGIATATTHARNFEEHLTQTLQVIDLTAGSIDPLNNGRVDPAELGRRMTSALRPAPFLRSISLADGQGRIVASSNPDNLGVAVALDGFYPPAAPEVEVLRVGGPWRGRDLAAAEPFDPRRPLAPGDASFVPVLRRLPAAGDLYLVAALNPDYFINHFTQLLDPEDGHVQWLRYDDVLLFSSSARESPGTRGAAGAVAARLPEREHGKLDQTLPGGQAALTAYRASSRFPAIVAVHIDRAHVLDEWAGGARRLGSIVLPVLGALSIAGVLAWRRQRNIAAQQDELARERRLAASVFDASSDSIILTTPAGDIIAVNPAFERITGYRSDEVLGKNPRLLASGMQDREFYRRLWEALLTCGHWQGELVNRRKDGSLYTGWATIHAVRDDAGTLLHYVGITADISERKQYEAGLLEAKERSEAAAMAKTSFLATMSHEIRTPMNGVLGMAELLSMSELAPEQREQLDIVRSSAESLLTLLNEILDFSKIEAQGISLEAIHFDPAEVVGHLVGLFGARAESRGLKLAASIDRRLPQGVVSDPTRLRQILTNLISNALKFTHAGEIRLVADAGPVHTDGTQLLRFEVIDTGIGIPADKQETIFEAFAQADDSITRTYGGTGLGLAISRRLARAMGGDLGVFSAPGAGSRFVLEIRVLADQEPPVQTERRQSDRHRHPAPVAAMPRMHVLVAEDNPTNQVVMRGMLEKLGHQVTVAANGADAVALTARQAFDAILMDMQMPVMDGLEATRAIRVREGGGRRTPVVALTANAFAADREACLAAGMDDFLSKPVTLAELEKALRRCRPGPMEMEHAQRSDASAGDRDAALARMGGDEELLKMAVSIFLTEAPERLRQLEASLNAGQAAEARRHAHSLKGAAADVGAGALREIAAGMERNADAGDIDAVRGAFPGLAHALERFAAANRNAYDVPQTPDHP